MAQKIEKIQAALEEKVARSHDLQEQLAQALDLAHSRDARHEEMMEKFELLMRQQTDRYILEAPEPETQETEATSASPPPKKANTNASPSRHVYAMFRQQTGKHLSKSTTMSKHFAARQSSPKTAAKNMDIDDDYSLSKPVVRPGKKLE